MLNTRDSLQGLRQRCVVIGGYNYKLLANRCLLVEFLVSNTRDSSFIVCNSLVSNTRDSSINLTIKMFALMTLLALVTIVLYSEVKPTKGGFGLDDERLGASVESNNSMSKLFISYLFCNEISFFISIVISVNN